MLAGVLCLASAVSASAQSAKPTRLEVPATASWQHAATGMILPPVSARFVRQDVSDNSGGAELDVAATYQDSTTGTVATVYVFRTMLPDAPLWFDRALDAILLRPNYKRADASPPAVTAFTPPKASRASGLRTSVALVPTPLRSTALAVAPVGGWLVKVRMSSESLDAAALDARLSAFIDELRWPAEAKAPKAAAPIAPCATPLRFKKAKIVHDDLAQVLINSVTGGLALEAAEDSGPTAVYCREPGLAPERAVYRPSEAANSYAIAMDDAGTILQLAPALTIKGIGSGGKVSMTLMHRQTSDMLPSFNRLPSPDQAVNVLNSGRNSGISVEAGDGKNR
jgi:hypothetical protein